MLTQKPASVDVIPSMDNSKSSLDNPHPSMDNLSVDRHTSTDKSSSRNLNSSRRSTDLGGAS